MLGDNRSARIAQAIDGWLSAQLLEGLFGLLQQRPRLVGAVLAEKPQGQVGSGLR